LNGRAPRAHRIPEKKIRDRKTEWNKKIGREFLSRTPGLFVVLLASPLSEGRLIKISKDRFPECGA